MSLIAAINSSADKKSPLVHKFHFSTVINSNYVMLAKNETEHALFFSVVRYWCEFLNKQCPSITKLLKYWACSVLWQHNTH